MNRTISKTVDLSKFQAVDQLTSPLYQLEVDGHTFEITVLRDKTPVDVSGSVAARFIRPDGTTVSFTGSASGNVATITLPQACYLYNGRFGMVIFVSGSGTTMALYACTGSVYKSTTDAVIDPDQNIPTLEDLLAQIEACEDATSAANAAAADASAAALAGVRTDTNAQGLSETQKSNARTNIDAAGTVETIDLAESIFETPYTTTYDVISGGINGSGANKNYAYLARTQYFDVNVNNGYLITFSNSNFKFVNAFLYGSSVQSSVTRGVAVNHNTCFFFANTGENKCRISFARADDTTSEITSAEFEQIKASISIFISSEVRTDTNAQGLSTTQKANARTNIDAASTADVTQLSDDITQLSSDTSQLSDEIDMLADSVGETVTWEVGTQGAGQDYASGSTISNQNRDTTKYTDISAYKYLRYAAVWSAASSTLTGTAFFSEKTAGSYISGVQGYSNASTATYREQWAEVPAGAVYARFTLIAASTDGFFIEGYRNLPVALNTKTAELKNDIIDIISHPCDNIGAFSIGGIADSTGKTNNTWTNRLRLGYTKVVPNQAYMMKVDSTYDIRTLHAYTSNSESTWIEMIASVHGKSVIFKTPDNCNYVRAMFNDDEDPDHTMTSEDVEAITSLFHMYTVGSVLDKDDKKDKTGNYEFFTVDVGRPLPFNDESVTTGSETVECVLRLPDSYTPYGKPTRLIFMAHGAHGYIDAANNHWYSSNWTWLCNQLLAAGYAVFDTNTFADGTTDPNVIGYGVGGPLYINVVKKAYDYIQDNYNVYEQIFCHGTSMGGVGATTFSHVYPQLVLAESSFAGRDILRYIWAMVENELDSRFPPAFGYTDFTALNADKYEHVDGLSPSLALKRINADGTITMPPDRETDYSNWLAFWHDLFASERATNVGTWIGIRRVPYKAWNSWQDNENSTKLEETLQNAYVKGSSCPYYIVNYETGSHDDMCFGKVNDMANQLITWYKRWE